MKYFLILLTLYTSLFADTKYDLLTLYKNGDYMKACQLGRDNYQHYTRDEEFISLYGFSCLHADYIDRLAVPISALKYSAEARANAAYFATVLMQKKLLYHALVDQYDIRGLSIPSTNYVLSTVFNLYCQNPIADSNGVFVYTDSDDKTLTYRLYLKKEDDITKMVIEVFHDKILQKRHLYW